MSYIRQMHAPSCDKVSRHPHKHTEQSGRKRQRDQVQQKRSVTIQLYVDVPYVKGMKESWTIKQAIYLNNMFLESRRQLGQQLQLADDVMHK